MISKLLMNQDLHFPSVYGTVDEKAQATTYFIADYIDTIDIDHALWIYRGVTLLTDLQSNFFWINKKYYSRYGIPVRPKMTDQVMFRNNQNAQESIITHFDSK